MSFTIKKQDGILIFNDLGGYQRRNPSTIWCIKEADSIYKWNDFNGIIVDTNDNYKGTNCSYIKDNFINLIPDFVFHQWSEAGIDDYTDFIRCIDNSGLMEPIINKVGWIGSLDTNILRNRLFDIGKQNPNLFDIIPMSWIPSENIRLDSTKYISTPDLVKNYSILIDIEGAGPYSARLKTLLWSHRPLLLVSRPGNEYFFEFLKEWEHYIPVKRDLSDLVEKAKWCIDNYVKAKQIAENAYEFSKEYLTRDACYRQWDKVIKCLYTAK